MENSSCEHGWINNSLTRGVKIVNNSSGESDRKEKSQVTGYVLKCNADNMEGGQDTSKEM